MSPLRMRSRATSLCLALSCFLFSGQARGQFSTILNVPPDRVPRSLGSDTQLNLFEGGSIRSGFQAGSPFPRGSRSNIEVNISGGLVREDFHAFDASTVNISGGSVRAGFATFEGSTVNITGGSVGEVVVSSGSLGEVFGLWEDSVVNISGGSVGKGFRASRSTVNITGGSVGRFFEVDSGSTVNISGGSFGSAIEAFEGSTLHLLGGEFRLDGLVVDGLDTVGDTIALNLPETYVLSGTLADGTPFAFSSADWDRIPNGTLTLEAAVLPAIGPQQIMLPGGFTPLGIRTGQTLVVAEGGTLGDNFRAGWGSTVHVSGGSVGQGFEAVGAQVNISGGSVGARFDAFSGSEINVSGGSIGGSVIASNGSRVNISGGSIGGAILASVDSTVNISGGSVGRSSEAHSGSTVNISGGSVGHGFKARSRSTINISGGSVGGGFIARFDTTVNISGGSVGNSFEARSSTVNISGGSVGGSFEARGSSTVNISGGSIGNIFHALIGSEVNLFGTEFVLDGTDVSDTLILNEPLTIGDRDVPLSGLFVDGSAFAFELNSLMIFAEDFFDPNAALTVTLVLPGDANADGVVNIDDLNNVRNSFGALGPDDGSLLGDTFPYDGQVNIDDLNAVRNNFGAGVTAVPEPGTWALLTMGLLGSLLMRKGRWTHQRP